MDAVQQRLIDMQEVWMKDLEHNLDDIASDGIGIPRVVLLRLKRIKREINEEIEAYDEATK